MELSLLRTQCERDSSYVLPNHHTPQATVIRLYKILRLLPQLRDLNVYRLSIRDFRRAQQFTSTLLDMVNLERLAITLGHKASYPGIAKALFFGCPPSIKRLHINRVHPCLREDYGNPYIGSRFARFEKSAAEILPRRSAQMVNLRDLSLEDWEDSATKEEFFSIFQQCPGLEKLRMIDPTVLAGVDAGIGRICPNLRDIKLKGATLSPFDIMENLPEQRLETLDYTTLSHPQLEAITIGKTFLRHSYSLQAIKIDSPTQSATLRMILGTCEGGLRHLSMDINIALPPSSSLTLPGADYVPYYFKVPSAPPATDDELIFFQLEIFYRQIGELKDMFSPIQNSI
ncbi:hypothetical protein BGZ47_008064 [Haplosporangium gracile]|nr:hypothetical protein BGZ47_008064 [Haplosporangium gracile]